MPEWIVTYTSIPLEADSAEEAIAREGSGGGHWQARPFRQGPAGGLDVAVDVITGDANLPYAIVTVGEVRVVVYHHFDDGGPLPVVVVDVDRGAADLEVRTYIEDAPSR